MTPAPSSIVHLVMSFANDCGVDPNLALALAQHESGFDPLRVRYERSWSHLLRTNDYAKVLGITETTEIMFQSCSWNVLQVMGTVARELGYHGHLSALIDPKLGIFYGCLKLKDLKKKYASETNLISAFNAGTPGLVNGRYRNQQYVDDVVMILDQIRSA